MPLTLAEVPLILLRLFGVVVIAIFIGVPIGAIVIKRKGARRLETIIAGVIANIPAEGPIVHLQFHTYHGLIVFADQTTHNLNLPLSQAREMLSRFRNFNWSWGLFAYGFLFIPILSHFEYRSQVRAIEQQAKVGQPG